MPYSETELEDRMAQIDAIMTEVETAHGFRYAGECIFIAQRLRGEIEALSSSMREPDQLSMLRRLSELADVLFSKLKEAARKEANISMTFAGQVGARGLDQ